MYAKALIPATPTTPAVPMLIITASEGSIVLEQLRSTGWRPYGTWADGAPGEVRIATDRLQVIVHAETILDDRDGDPVSPPGWWEAVSDTADCCVVVVTRAGTLTLGQSDSGRQLASLLDSPDAVSAVVPVTH